MSPYGVSVPSARRYLPGSLILETTWQTPTGWLIVRDALVMGPWHDIQTRSRTHSRAPMDWDAEHIMLRTVRCVSGTVDLVMDCEPAFDYNRISAGWEYSGSGYGEAIARANRDPDAHPTLALTTDLRFGLEGRQARARTRLKDGDNAFVALSWGKNAVPQTYDEAADRMWTTSECWRQWMNIGDFPDHPWRSYLQRSALTLKGLTYSPTGALLAASTTSLPETPRGERNWDYRYAWIRDSTFALWGLYTLGLDREADDFFSFIADVSGANNREQHPLQVMYAVGGERTLVEEELHHLSGYDGARPVRIGNGAYTQSQNDIWGSMLDSVYLHSRSREQIPETLWPVLKQQVEEAIKHWREPDRGIWEVRGDPQHFTSSKVMCWVALDRGAKLAELHGWFSHTERWRAIAEEIKADVLANGVDSRGVFVQRYGSDALDASLLLVVLTRFLPPDDPRVRNTVLAIADELTQDGLVLRYRVEETDDGLSGEEGTFTICSFWLVSALVEIGEISRARHLCERLLSFASPLHLYAEEIEPRTGRHLGNFPQAFTHLALINAVVHVIRAEDEADSSGAFQPANAPK
jgi:alpha,alpha-trehalase